MSKKGQYLSLVLTINFINSSIVKIKRNTIQKHYCIKKNYNMYLGNFRMSFLNVFIKKNRILSKTKQFQTL